MSMLGILFLFVVLAIVVTVALANTEVEAATLEEVQGLRRNMAGAQTTAVVVLDVAEVAAEAKGQIQLSFNKKCGPRAALFKNVPSF